MKFELRDMYSYLISHTFPGALLGAEILLTVQWFFNVDVFSFLERIWSNNTGSILVIIIGTYAISTLLGIIIDGIHHFFFEDLIDAINKCRKKGGSTPQQNFYDGIVDDISLSAYKYFVEDGYYYPSESYANISVVMVPGVCLLRHWLLYILNYEWCSLKFFAPFVTYLFVLAIMIYEAVETYRQSEEEGNDFVDSFSKRKSHASTNNDKK